MLLRRMVLGLSACALVLTSAACTQDSPSEPEPEPTRTPESAPREVTFGTYGTKDEVEAMRSVVEEFNAASTTRKVEMVAWPDHETALEAVLAGEAPDVFMASRIDLGTMVDAEALQPVSLLLDERGVDFGDRFARSAVNAFALDDELQCMAYAISPMVIYYNTKHVDFDKMAQRELDVPARPDRWTLAEFGDAARFASRRGKVRGVWIEPSLQGLTPFIRSGGGKVFDDDDEPTSLAFSDESTREALAETLAILRDSTLTPTGPELARSTPLQMFKRGKLAMMAGFRNLVPELRATEGLSFDVIAMPNLDGAATVGDISGLCISADSEVTGDAADFIAHAVSDEAFQTVTETGYIVPANTEVASSEVFLDETQQPEHASVFINGLRPMVVPPFIEDREALVAAVDPLLQRMLTEPVLDLEAIVEEIDAASRTVLSPEPEPDEGEEPSEEPSEDPSE